MEYNYVYSGDTVIAITRDNSSDVFNFICDENGDYIGFTYGTGTYYYIRNLQNDVVAIVDVNQNVLVTYSYDPWGNCTTSGALASTIGDINPIRYRGYFYDTETGLYYLQSRYYDPQTCRFIIADEVIADVGGDVLGYNLFVYCMNNPINRFDDSGNWSMPNWSKILVGAVATIAAVAITVATGGAAAPVLIGVVASTVSGAAVSAVKHRVTTGSWEGADKAALDGAADGFMWGGIGALGGATIRAAKISKAAKEGIVIGKCGSFEQVAKDLGCEYYGGLKGYNLIEKFSKPLAQKLGWAQNKSFLNGVMKLGGEIFDMGGDLTGSYAKERILTFGYKHITWIGGKF